MNELIRIFVCVATGFAGGIYATILYLGWCEHD